MTGLPDLHRHLDGSLRQETIEQLAKAQQVYIPRRLKFHKGMGLEEALSKFKFTLEVLQGPEAVRRVASEVCEDAAAEGVTTLEIRFGPQLHRGASSEAIVDAALEGANGRAGLILCGLYGEPPEILESHVRIAASRPGVVGIDLAGGPSSAHRYILEDYARAFRMAEEHGIGRTVHAGEGRPADEIAMAVESLHAQRIGHGISLLDDLGVTELILEREVTLEACITSNLQTGCIDHADDHPLRRWIEMGVRACVCTDNTLLSDVTSTSEHALARTIPGMTQELLDRAVAWGHAGAFKR